MGLLSSLFSGKGYCIPHGTTPKEHASKLIDSAKWHADEINKATNVFDFVYSYNKLLNLIYELIWLNEKKKVFMYPTPRSNWDQIQRNMTASINDFVDRGISQISSSSQGIQRSKDIEKFLQSVEGSKDLNALITEENKRHIANIRNEIREKDRKQRESELLSKVGDEPLDLNCFENEPFLLIEKMETCLSDLYQHFLIDGLSQKDGRALFERFKKNLKESKLPLLVEIRLESLLDEYESNFSSDSDLFLADQMDGHSFEAWCAGLLKRNGFSNVEVTPGSGDQGVDIIAEKDGVFYAIQCKCYSAHLGNKPVQEVYAGKEVYRCQVGVVMTNSYFTNGAKELAQKTRVLLWDRDKLFQMLNTI